MIRVKKKLNEDIDIKKIIKDLQGNFGGSNEKQMAGVEILRGISTSDEKIANEFMKKLDTETTKISKEILGDKKEEGKLKEISGSSTHLEKLLKNLFNSFGLKVKWAVDSIEIVMPSEDWYQQEFSKSGKLEEFNNIIEQFNVEYDIVEDVIIIFI